MLNFSQNLLYTSIPAIVIAFAAMISDSCMFYPGWPITIPVKTSAQSYNYNCCNNVGVGLGI